MLGVEGGELVSFVEKVGDGKGFWEKIPWGGREDARESNERCFRERIVKSDLDYTVRL